MVGHVHAITKPSPGECEEWSAMYMLNKEKEMVGIYLSAHPLDEYKFEIENLNITPLSAMKDLVLLKDKDISITGLVTQASERLTKNGNPYGSITIEDYTDSFSMLMFSKDYIKFKNFFTNGYSLMLKGKIQENPWRKDPVELEFKVTDICMLQQVREDMVKSILLKMPLDSVSEELIDDLSQYSTSDNGGVMLKFTIIDTNDNIGIEMFSRNQRVSITEEFINYLKNNTEIEYKVNA